MKIAAHPFNSMQWGSVFAMMALSSCGVLLGGYGEDPQDGVGGNAGIGETSTSNSGSGVSGGFGGSGSSSSSSSGMNTGGNAPVCAPTPINIGLGEGPLPLTGSTANEKNIVVPAIASNCPHSAAGPERIYAVTPGSDGILTAMTIASGTKFDSVLYARKGNCSDGTTEICADRTSVAHDLFGGEVLSFPVKIGEVWNIIVDGYQDVANGKGNYELRLSLRTGQDSTSAVPVRFEVGSPMTLRGDVIEGGVNNDIFTPTCGGLGELVYQIEYGTGVQKIDFDAVPLINTLAPALYGTTTAPSGGVSPEVGCNAGGCGETASISTTPTIKFLVVDGALPGFDVCNGATKGPYNLIAKPNLPP